MSKRILHTLSSVTLPLALAASMLAGAMTPARAYAFSEDLCVVTGTDGRPRLEDCLDARSCDPKYGSTALCRANLIWRREGRDPNLLLEQRWGIVAPAGRGGDRMLELVEPLRALRQSQQGNAVEVYRVPAELDAAGATRWKDEVLRDEKVLERDHPRYLLILGDLDQVSLELQQRLASDVFVGRLAFPDDRGFEGYVEKVRRLERAGGGEPGGQAGGRKAGAQAGGREAGAQAGGEGLERRALFFTAQDGTRATILGQEALMVPGLERLRAYARAGGEGAEVQEIRGRAEGGETGCSSRRRRRSRRCCSR